MEINIAHFFPELLNLYGDKGNVCSLVKRCEWRGIKVNFKEYDINDSIDFSEIDIAIVGGGNDYAMQAVLNRFREISDELREYIENNGVMLVLCSAYPMFGKKFPLSGKQCDGLSVIDAETVTVSKRLISNVIIETEFGMVAGFENHGTVTYVRNHNPFGKVIYGNGNNGEDKTEGVIYKNLFASYLHGPLLPKNPHLTDNLIKRALERKYNEPISLEELDDSVELSAFKHISDRFIKE